MIHSTASKWFLVYGFLVIAFSIPTNSHAQKANSQKTSSGREFWVCFPQNARSGENSSNLKLKLFITSETSTSGSVWIPGRNEKIPFAFKAGGVATISVDTSLEILESEKVLNCGVQVIADQDVSVFGLCRRRASTDTYLALPVNTLGTTYRAMGYAPLNDGKDGFATEFAIVATEDNTSVVINLNARTRGGKNPGDTHAIALQKGEVYMVHGMGQRSDSTDLTGSLVTSNKPIAFMVGHSCAQVPVASQFCDQLLEMEPPTSTWGKEFVIGTLTGKQEYALRVLASDDNTEVSLNSKRVAVLKAGEFYENNHMNENCSINSSKPVLVAEYAQSASADSIQVGDPFMMLITPTKQFLSSYRFAIPIQGDWHHYLNLVVPHSAIGSVRIDGQPLVARYFHAVGNSKYDVASYEVVGSGSHNVVCDEPLGLCNYGFGIGGDNFDSYGNPCGQSMETINPNGAH